MGGVILKPTLSKSQNDLSTGCESINPTASLTPQSRHIGTTEAGGIRLLCDEGL